MRPGTYTITFSLAGFSTFKREGISLTAGFTADFIGRNGLRIESRTAGHKSRSPIEHIDDVGVVVVDLRFTWLLASQAHYFEVIGGQQHPAFSEDSRDLAVVEVKDSRMSGFLHGSGNQQRSHNHEAGAQSKVSFGIHADAVASPGKPGKHFSSG